MHVALLLVSSSVLAASGSGSYACAYTCDTSTATLQAWTLAARATLAANYSVSTGHMIYAPIGTISDPTGTYGAVILDADAAYPPNGAEFCSCLGGDASVAPACNQASKPTFSGSTESVCKGTYVLKPGDALIVVGCTPPAVQYFGLQSNVFSKFLENGTGIWYPEVSPLNAINQMNINTTGGQDGAAPADSGFALISTADRRTADAVARALSSAGMPDIAINYDPLATEYIDLWSGGEWQADLPDTLQLVARINVDASSAAVDAYIAASAAVNGSNNVVMIVRAPETGGEDAPFTWADWTPRFATASETAAVATYSAVLDETAQVINATAAARGYVLSYFGDVIPTMNYGYTQFDPNDIAQCCLDWPHPTYIWSYSTHFSTRDCLYHAFGQGPYENSSFGFGGTTKAVNLEAIGAPSTVVNYLQYRCSNESLYAAFMCVDDTCGKCNYELPKSGACTPYQSFSYTIACVDGEPYQTLYVDDACEETISTHFLGNCTAYQETTPSEALWAGGYLKTTSIIVVVGAMSNRLNSSTFHDLYYAVPAKANEPSKELDFSEPELDGSALPWMSEGGSPATQENIFVAQFGRSCLATPSDEAVSACFEISEEDLYSPGIVMMFGRHYLDPQTGTGPSEDALPPSRVLVFDKLP
jgi:hypothetical protein